MKQLIFILATLSISAFALDKDKPKDDPISAKCKTVALQKAVDKFQEESGFTDQQMDDLTVADESNVELSFNHSGKISQADVRINSANVVDWDGYADYNVPLREIKTGCRAGKATQTASEGL
jgi:hypothetical protein